MTGLVTVVATVVVFGMLILIHELGHFLMARRAGVRVHEFALGFGPRVLSTRRGPTMYSLRAVPLGGFVRMAGMHPGEEDWAAIPARERFLDQPIGTRAAIIAAGPAMNILLAVLLFALVFAAVGLEEPTLEVARVVPGMPAQEAGLQPGDEITAVAGQPVNSWEQLARGIQSRPGEPTELEIRRDGSRLTITVTPVEQSPGYGVIGIEPVMITKRTPPLQAIGEGMVWTGRVIVSFFDGLARMFAGQGGADIIGPVGIGQHIGEATRMGLANVMLLAAVLSANLALINLLPIPALDGSRLVFLAWEWIRGRPVDPDKEGFVHFVGFALLLVLAILITYRDILNLA